MTKLKSHDVVTAIYVDHFAGDAGAGIGSQKHSGRADFIDIHITLQRRAFGMGLQHIAKTGNAPRRQGLDGPAEMALTRIFFLPRS